MGRAGRPVEPWARPPWNVLLPPKRSRGPPPQGYLQMRRFTTGHKPPEAFCHLPKLQRARESAPPALERNPHEAWTLQPTDRSALPSSLSTIVLAILVSAPGRPAPSRCQTLQILVFNKVPVSTFCMPLCKVTHRSSYRSLRTRGLMGLKMLYVNIHLV